MECSKIINDNNYVGLILRDNGYLGNGGTDECVLPIDARYSIGYFPYTLELMEEAASNRALPGCYAPLSLEALDVSGILQVQDVPSLALFGEGILIGFLDSGIDVRHPAFLDEAGNTRVVCVWDQNAVDNQSSYYGSVYEGKEVLTYGNHDASGHGTFVASVAAGSVYQNHRGAAPKAEIAMVHLRQAKRNLRNYYYIPEDVDCYDESDIMLGVAFLDELAKKRGQALVICMSVGNALGSHSGNTQLSLYLNELAVAFRRCVVSASGNMAASRHHYLGQFLGNLPNMAGGDGGTNAGQQNVTSYTEKQGDGQVEIVVGESVCGFVMEQWAMAPTQYEVAVISPGGKRFPEVGYQSAGRVTYDYAVEETKVTIDFGRPELTTGNQRISFRFDRPAEGIWMLQVRAKWGQQNTFHIYLPEEDLMCEEVYFLRSSPENTIENPGNAPRVLTIGGYNQRRDAILLESGRGYTIDGTIKPDLAAPAYMIDGAVASPENVSYQELEDIANVIRENELEQYEQRTGTSAAVAIGAGAAALYMEWCNRRGDIGVNTTQVKNFLIRGARRFSNERYPNTRWGYGALDLYEAFRGL